MSNLLCELSVENFLSYNSLQKIDFSNDHVSCFVGHNGSGKTNLLLAISTLSDMYLNPNGKKRRIGTSFDQQKKPTMLQIEFSVDNEKYFYTIECLSSENIVIKEELRNGDKKLILDMELYSDVGELSEIEKERITTYSVNEIGIFHLLFNGQVKIQNSMIVDAIEKAGRFFESIVYVNQKSLLDFDYEKVLYESKETKDLVLGFMNKLNYEIDDIVVEKVTNRIESIMNDESREAGGIDELMNALKNFVISMPESQRTAFDTDYSVRFLKRPYLKNPISIGLESAGVKRLIEILTWIYANRSSIILVDELEKGFHELLVMSLVKEVNANVNQFVFTSHLLELMTRNCLSKNQLFSVVKEKGQSVVYPLSDIINIRDDRHSLKNLYRAGKIPGYPLIAE